MINKYILAGTILILIGFIACTMMIKTPFANYIAPYAPKQQKNWWRRPGWERFGYPSYTFWQSGSEGFENLNDRPASVEDESRSSLLLNSKDKESSVLEYPPDSPAPAEVYNNRPYHLLGDEMPPPRVNESISCVNSRSCYATDFERMVSKTGNYRQMTNNYKRGYPDSCSAPYQELVLNFYKADVMPIPSNNTGGSVSEVGFGLNTSDYTSQ
jgi:hypothetical protein